MPSVIQSGSEDNLNSNRNDKKIDVMPVSDDSTSLDGLLWKDNIGYLPDSDLKFRKNEFDMLELISNGDIRNSASCSEPISIVKSPFIKVPMDFANRFEPGMKLEAITPGNSREFSVVTIAGVNGHRVRVHLDGYATNFDYWTNGYSPFLRPVGYCEAHKKHLRPPRGFDSAGFSWSGYLQMTNSSPAPTHCFYEAKAKCSSVSERGVRVGMRLMADWYHNNNGRNNKTTGAASVREILDDNLLLIISDNDGDKDFWTGLDSPFIHVVNSEMSTADAVPPEAFFKRENLRFADSTLECVDPNNQGNIVEGHIVKHEGNRLLIALNEAQIWLPEDSESIFPRGFCRQMQFHQGKVQVGGAGEKSGEVERSKSLFNPELIGLKSISDLSRPPSLEPELMETGDENSCQGRFDYEEVPDGEVVEPNVKRKRKRKKFALSMPAKGRKSSKATGKSNQSTAVESNENLQNAEPTVSDVLAAAVHKSVFGCEMWVPESAVSPCWQKLLPSKLIPQAAGLKVEDVRRWSVEKVGEFVRSLPGCTTEHGNLFQAEMIDGEALLLLKQTDITDILNFKLGPALKIYNSILYFNENSNNTS